MTHGFRGGIGCLCCCPAPIDCLSNHDRAGVFSGVPFFCSVFASSRGSQGAEGVVTLGETSVLTEFQISNDLLRKR